MFLHICLFRLVAISAYLPIAYAFEYAFSHVIHACDCVFASCSCLSVFRFARCSCLWMFMFACCSRLWVCIAHACEYARPSYLELFWNVTTHVWGFVIILLEIIECRSSFFRLPWSDSPLAIAFAVAVARFGLVRMVWQERPRCKTTPSHPRNEPNNFA